MGLSGEAALRVFAGIPARQAGQHPPPVEILWVFGAFISIGVLFIPYGTILSIFTLLVLDRGSVKRLYEERAT